jgi:hypothetical protein
MRRFYEKTGNLWSDRNNFVKQPKKYQLMEIDYNDSDTEEEKEEKKEKKPEVFNSYPMKIIVNVRKKRERLKFQSPNLTIELQVLCHLYMI